MKIVKINNNFNEEVLNYKGLAVVDFWASWCGPCMMFGPIFENVSKKFEEIKFCKLNVDEDTSDISSQMGVMSIPCIIIFKDGKEIERHIGLIVEDELSALLGEIHV